MDIKRYVPEQEVQRAGLLAWTPGLGAVTAEAVAERNEVSVEVAEERLEEAVRLGLMEKTAILVGYSPLYSVTIDGRRLARKHEVLGGYRYPLGITKWHVTIRSARHTIACASVAAALERRYPGHRVIGELELYRDGRKGGQELPAVEIGGVGGMRVHHPDMVIWPPAVDGEQALPVAVEVELTNKRKEELREICSAVARCRQIEGAVYYAETTKVEEKLLDVIEELKVQEKIVVNPLSELLGDLPGFELSPWSADD